MIVVENLRKSFTTPAGDLEVLKGIDAGFRHGEMVSIVGASGAGKSTLLHILGTLDRPTSGSVRFTVRDKGEPVDPFSLRNGDLALFRNRVIGFVFQFHYLLPEFSAIENVMMPGLLSQHRDPAGLRQSSLKERAETLLGDLGLLARKDHKPGELSGGEQQRVAVARALFLEPELILADEPTGNLDTATGEDLFRLMKRINESRGITFIVVTHNESLSRRCHRMLEMVDGRLYVRNNQ